MAKDYTLNFFIPKKAVKDLLKQMNKPITENNIKTALEHLQGTAVIDIEYNLDTPQDILAGIWEEKDVTKKHKFHPSTPPKNSYVVSVSVSEDSIIEALQKLELPIVETARVYFLKLLETLADLMIENDIEDPDLMEFRMFGSQHEAAEKQEEKDEPMTPKEIKKQLHKWIDAMDDHTAERYLEYISEGNVP